MKIGDYFLVSDLQRLSEEQYNALLLYLKFMGIGCQISYDEITEHWPYWDDVIVAWSMISEPKLLWSNSADEDLVKCLSYDDILRMVPLGSLV